MPRTSRTDLDVLRQEARAIEMLADEIDVPFDRTQEYWAISTDLLTMVIDIEQLQAEQPELGHDDPQVLALRRRLREITGRLAQISSE